MHRCRRIGGCGRMGRVAERGVTGPGDPAGHAPPYPVGLRLEGRRVVVVGGGHVAQRRVPTLLTAGAEVTLVAPHVTPAPEGPAGGGEISWERRGVRAADRDRAWDVLGAADDP